MPGTKTNYVILGPVCSWLRSKPWTIYTRSSRRTLINGSFRVLCKPRLFFSRINGPIVTNFRWHKTRKKDVSGIVTFDLIGVLPTNHIIAYITMALTKVFENTLNNVKYLKLYCQNWVESTEEMAILAIIRGFHTLIWRLREKRSKNWSLPDYPGEVTALLVAQAVAQTFLLRSTCIWSKDKYAHKAEHRAFEIVPWLLIRMRVLMYVRT